MRHFDLCFIQDVVFCYIDIKTCKRKFHTADAVILQRLINERLNLFRQIIQLCIQPDQFLLQAG